MMDNSDTSDEGSTPDDIVSHSPPGELQDESKDDDEKVRDDVNQTVYDFDIMMAKKKEESSRRKKRKNYDIINDNDDMIADIINQMKDAVEADIDANKSKVVATGKLKLLPFVINQLRKVDLRDAFLDSDVLRVITEWLAPLPDRSLPHLNIRESLLKILIDFNLYDVERIKNSGIGKAVMYLYKHPKETKENKQRAKQLISSWSRPIFNLDSSFSAISREEREERDKELQKKASRHVYSSDGEGSAPTPKRPKEDPSTSAAQKPGEKGWIPRARVPAPSMRDYVIRPRSKVDGDIEKGSKRPTNMLERLMKTQQDRQRANKRQRAVNMKIDKL